VARLEIPKLIDRALGDIHPGGNPHIHTDPRNIAKVAEVLAERLAQLDPSHADAYKARAASFRQRWQAAIARWETEAASLRNTPVVVYHKEWTYLEAWLDLKEVGSLEPKPGIPPTPGHLADLVGLMRRAPAKLIIYSAYNDPRAAGFLSARTNIPAVMLPYTVGGSEQAKDLFSLFDDTIARLKAGVK
jgi:zinc/manganese transport system substrate-binding protein